MFYTREFELSALARLEAMGDVQEVARELHVRHSPLNQWRRRYKWRRDYSLRAADALRACRRPQSANPSATGAPASFGDEVEARQRIAALEREISQQRLVQDVFRATARQAGLQTLQNIAPVEAAYT